MDVNDLRSGVTVLSMLVHAMVVAGAVQATERVVTSAGLARSDTLKFVLARPERAATEVQDEAPLPGAMSVSFAHSARRSLVMKSTGCVFPFSRR